MSDNPTILYIEQDFEKSELLVTKLDYLAKFNDDYMFKHVMSSKDALAYLEKVDLDLIISDIDDSSKLIDLVKKARNGFEDISLLIYSNKVANESYSPIFEPAFGISKKDKKTLDELQELKDVYFLAPEIRGDLEIYNAINGIRK